jgi:transcriptional regulator
VRLIEEGSELLQLLDDLTRENESAFQHPWQVPDAPAGYIEGLMGAIVGFELTIDKIEGKWKLSQNRPDADRRGVREGLGRLDSPRAQMTARKMSEE